MWEEFKDRLSEHEVRALEVVLCGSDLKALRDELRGYDGSLD
jgi:hypothetical protein